MPDAAMKIPCLSLRNGLSVPVLSIGTYKADQKTPMQTVIQLSLEQGFRAIDAAEHYHNEDAVGKAIRQSGFPREDIYLSTKIWNEDHGYEKTRQAFAGSVARLQTSPDMIMIHWPCPMNGLYQETWRALCDLYQEKRVRAIGVSNFKVSHLEELRAMGLEMPMVNQVEMHPYYIDEALLSYCAQQGIVVEAWSPLVRSASVTEEPLIRELAEKYTVTPVQIVIRYLTQYGVRVIVKASAPEHIRQNADIFSFAVEEEDIEKMKTLNTGKRVFQDPDTYYL